MKLYVDEVGYEAIRGLRLIAVSSLSRLEVVSALNGKQRAGELAPDLRRLLVVAFEQDYFGVGRDPARFDAIRIDVDAAAEVLVRHPLRTGDSIQLSAALAARELDDSCEVFACFDDRLRSAAAAEGFALLPEEITAVC